MLKTTIKRTGIAIATALTLSIGGAGLTTSAQAEQFDISSIQSSDTVHGPQIIDVRGRSFRGRGGVRFRGHSRGFNRSHFKRGHSVRSHKFSRHGKFHRGKRFSRHGGFRF